MPLILAVEPDQRRAAQVRAIVRAHVRATLVVAASASQALAALEGRLPDLLLTAPLLPPRDEVALSDYLRQQGTAVAHVQTLTIPLLAGSGPAAERGPLSSFRRDRQRDVESDGCEPDVFAEQIQTYLRAAEDRRYATREEPISAVRGAEPIVPVPAATSTPDSDEAVELILDEFELPELRTTSGEPKDIEAASHAPAIATGDSAAPAPRPPREEWAFFDPSQRGFPALLARLDEIAARDE